MSNEDLKCALCRSCPTPALLSPYTKKLQENLELYTFTPFLRFFSMPERYKDCGCRMLKTFVSKIAICYNILFEDKQPTHFTPRIALGAPSNTAGAQPASWPPLSNANSLGKRIHRANKTSQTSYEKGSLLEGKKKCTENIKRKEMRG